MAERHDSSDNDDQEQQQCYQCLPSPKQLRKSEDKNDGMMFQTQKHAYKEMDSISSSKKLADVIQDCNLPVRLSVRNSFYGIGDYFSFFSNDAVDVYFMRESIVANVKLSSGKAVKIPLNSDFRVSLVYDGSVKELNCHLTTPELMKAKPLPQIATVEKGCKLSKKSSAFLEGEIIVLHDFSDSKTIRCFSLLTEAEKKIHKSSKLILVANPTDSMVYFSDIEYLELPLQAKLHPSKKSLQEIFSAPCTIESLVKEQSVVSSFSSYKQMEENDVYEILTDVTIDFQLVQLSEQEKEFLSQKSEALYAVFTPMCVKKVIMNAEDGGDWLEQELYRMPRRGKGGGKGIKLFPPTVLSPTPASSTKHELSLHQHDPCSFEFSTEKHDYAPLNPRSVHFYMSLAQNVDTCSQQYEKIDDATGTKSFTRPRSQTLPKFNYVGMEMRRETISSSTKIKLEDLSKQQVIKMLELLGLTQYKKAFKREGISGSLLRDLDEGILEDELGISSRLHRLKLLRVIDGRESLDELFHND